MGKAVEVAVQVGGCELLLLLSAGRETASNLCRLGRGVLKLGVCADGFTVVVLEVTT